WNAVRKNTDKKTLLLEAQVAGNLAVNKRIVRTVTQQLIVHAISENTAENAYSTFNIGVLGNILVDTCWRTIHLIISVKFFGTAHPEEIYRACNSFHCRVRLNISSDGRVNGSIRNCNFQRSGIFILYSSNLKLN